MTPKISGAFFIHQTGGNVKSYIKNGRLVIELERRIDSNNSAQIEQEISQILDQNPGLPLTLDAKKLIYISSSGLRILIKLIKDETRDLTIQNVCTEVYEIFTITGFTTKMHIEKKMRSIDIEGCPVIGQGAFGTVYRLDGDTVVKVYKGGEASLPLIRDETERARKAFISGAPTAIPFDIVQVGDQYGSVFEMINAQNCSDIVVKDPTVLDTLLPAYAAFLKTLHGIEVTHADLPAARDIFLENLSAYGFCLDEDTYGYKLY